MLPPQVLFLGSYPPRECGIATFTKDVVDAYDRAFGFSSPVIAIDEPDAEVRRYPPEVVARIKEQSRESYARAAELRHPSIRSSWSTFSTNTGCSAANAANGSSISSACYRSPSS